MRGRQPAVTFAPSFGRRITDGRTFAADSTGRMPKTALTTTPSAAPKRIASGYSRNVSGC
jgi:hypothetical protein